MSVSLPSVTICSVDYAGNMATVTEDTAVTVVASGDLSLQGNFTSYIPAGLSCAIFDSLQLQSPSSGYYTLQFTAVGVQPVAGTSLVDSLKILAVSLIVEEGAPASIAFSIPPSNSTSSGEILTRQPSNMITN